MNGRLRIGVILLAGVVLLTGCAAEKPAAPPSQKPEPKTRAVAPPTEAPHWGYEATDGPGSWGKLSADWKICNAGKSQSPIDIDKTRKGEIPPIHVSFRPAELKIVHHEHMADVVNTGHSIQINYTEGDTLKLGAEEFPLIQYHFHSPSEHTVAGKQFPMEMHMVHKSAEGNLAVVGVFIEEGAANPAFEPVWKNLPESKSVEYHLQHVKVDVNQLLPKSNASYRYRGSLTTPPCSEGVRWIVMASPVQMSREQIESFRSVMKGNNRPTQPLHGRPVLTDAITETASK